MKLALICRLLCSLCFIFICFYSFSQQKTFIKDTIVEEIVYEYDTVYVDDIKLKIDTLHAPKPRFSLLPVNEPKLSVFILMQPLKFFLVYTAKVFVSLGISTFSTLYNFTKNSTINGITIIQDEKYFPSCSIGFGFIKRRFVYSINTEYRQYYEALQQSVPKIWKDTLDNGNEIFYRSINGQLKSEIKNQYQFLQINTFVGYKLGFNSLSFTPQTLIGVGFNLAQKNYYLDTLDQKIAEIKSANKVGMFFILGVSCPLGYNFKNGLELIIKPEYQHFFITQNVHPIKFRDIFGLNFSVAYSFKTYL